MSYKKNAHDNYDYSKIVCNNKMVISDFKKRYKEKNNVVKKEKKQTEFKEYSKFNILLNIEKTITMYEINHNDFNIYQKSNYYVDIDKLEEKLIDEKRPIQIKNR